MTLFNPCRKCIVRPMCRQRCHSRQDYWDTREKSVNIVCKSMVALAILTIIFNNYTFKY